MPSSPLLNLAPRRPLHQTGPTSPQLTRSEPSRRASRVQPSRKASLSTARSRPPAQSLYTDTPVDSCAVPELPPPRSLRQQRPETSGYSSLRPQVSAERPDNVYDELQPLRPAQTPGLPSLPGAQAKVFHYTVPGKGDADRTVRPQAPPAYPPIIYAELKHPTSPQTANRYKDSEREDNELQKRPIYSPVPLPAGTRSSTYSLAARTKPPSDMLPTEEQTARSPSSKRMTAASVGDFGQLDSEPRYADSEPTARRTSADYTYDKIDDDVPRYSTTARLSTSILDAAWAPTLPPREPYTDPPEVAPKPDYLNSRNPFAKQGPTDPYVKSGAVVGLTHKSFKKFIRDLDAAFILFYDPCDKKCCGAKVHVRQAAHTTQKPNHVYAAVDCTQERELCKKQWITTFPTMKLFVKGMIVDTYTHVTLLTNEIRNYVENAPIVRETVLDKHRCAIQ